MSANNKPFIHPRADVQSLNVGSGTRIWQNCVVMADAAIGQDCNICANCLVEGGVVIGDRVTIKCNVSVWSGVTLEDDVFVGPSVAFTNDKFPRSRQWPDTYKKTRICTGASIGANATILPVAVGANAMVGAGAVVTSDVPPNAVVVGNPARVVGYVASKEKCVLDDCTGVGSIVPTMMTSARLIDIPSFRDMRGTLSVIECERVLPFPIKRVFYTYGVPSKDLRGEHAHKKCHQFLVAVHGRLKVLVDDAVHRDAVILDNPSVGLLLPAGCWGVQYQHSPDCVLMVFASEPYESSDYIRNYDEFVNYRRKGGV